MLEGKFELLGTFYLIAYAFSIMGLLTLFFDIKKLSTRQKIGLLLTFVGFILPFIFKFFLK